jgi:hypothetical protein
MRVSMMLQWRNKCSPLVSEEGVDWEGGQENGLTDVRMSVVWPQASIPGEDPCQIHRFRRRVQERRVAPTRYLSHIANCYTNY